MTFCHVGWVCVRDGMNCHRLVEKENNYRYDKQEFKSRSVKSTLI